MNADDYQIKAQSYALYQNTFYPIASLMVESAEFADLFVKPKLRGDRVDIDREEVVKEAGDVLWNLALSLAEQEISLSEVMEANLAKLESRKARGVIQGSGGDR